MLRLSYALIEEEMEHEIHSTIIIDGNNNHIKGVNTNMSHPEIIKKMIQLETDLEWAVGKLKTQNALIKKLLNGKGN